MARTTTTSVPGRVMEHSTQRESTLDRRPPFQLPLFKTAIYLILTAGAILFVMPFLWMLSTSLMTPNEVARGYFIPESEFLGVHEVPESDIQRPLGEFLVPEAAVNFSGTSATLSYDTGPDGGAFDVYIDNQFIATIDTRSAEKTTGNNFVVDSYPMVPGLRSEQVVTLPDARHKLTLRLNPAESEGDQLLIRNIEVSDGSVITSGSDDFEIVKGFWTGYLADENGALIPLQSNDDQSEWSLDGEPVDETQIVRQAKNLGFPRYFERCCLSIIDRSPRLQAETQEEYIIRERPSGGHAILRLPIVDKSYIITGGVSHYLRVWDQGNFGEYFVNSVIITLLTVTGQTLFAIMAAYAFAKMQFPGRNALFALFLLTIFIPAMVTIIPNLVTVTKISNWSQEAARDLNAFIGTTLINPDSVKWIDNWPGLVIPFLASTFSIFLLRQFFMQVPDELWDAAQIDGAGHILYLFRVVVPISKAAITTVALFTFIGTWDALEWPLLVTRSDDWRPIAAAIYDFRNDEGARPNLLMAASMIAILPIMIVYFIAQRQFTEGIATSGLKG